MSAAVVGEAMMNRADQVVLVGDFGVSIVTCRQKSNYWQESNHLRSSPFYLFHISFVRRIFLQCPIFPHACQFELLADYSASV